MENLKEIHIDANKAVAIVIKNGFKIYPVCVGSQFQIEVEKPDGKIIRYQKLVSKNEVHAAQRKTNIAWAKEILKQKEDANKA